MVIIIEEKSVLVYRGSLKSCNYKCSYCPFSKRKMNDGELQKDKKDLDRFLNNLQNLINKINLKAVLITPYGEGMIHNYYIKGLACISSLKEIDKTGIQTNLSFNVDNMIKLFKEANGIVEKLCIWATFHPQMIDIDTFVEKVIKLKNAGVNISVGAVGVPQNISIIEELRKKLPLSIYIWINKMDGLKRKYSEEEKRVFKNIDTFFNYELNYKKADINMCQNRYFVESDGTCKLCNISNIKIGNIYDENLDFDKKCIKKVCTCFLAYGGREDFKNEVCFGDYSIFRIPEI